MEKLLYLAVILLFSCPLHQSTPLKKSEAEKEKVQEMDDVKQLQSLRTESGKPNHTEVLQSPPKNVGEPMPLSKLQQNSPIFKHRGITQAKKRTWADQQNNDSPLKFRRIQYSPLDLAAYVFNTGDEEGVAFAVEELVREGMMGRTDAINYLQEVKQMLAYLKNQYEQRRLNDLRIKAFEAMAQQNFANHPHEAFPQGVDMEKRGPKTTEIPSTTPSPEVVASTSALSISSTAAITEKSVKLAEEPAKSDDAKRHVPPRTSTDITLEVIYKLAKEMFTQSILRDDPTAEETLSELIAFLENEVGNKRISSGLKEKVLEIVSAALVDSLHDYQRYVSESSAVIDESGVFQQLGDPRGAHEIQKVPIGDVYHKLNPKINENMMQIIAPKMSRLPKSS